MLCCAAMPDLWVAYTQQCTGTGGLIFAPSSADPPLTDAHVQPLVSPSPCLGTLTLLGLSDLDKPRSSAPCRACFPCSINNSHDCACWTSSMTYMST